MTTDERTSGALIALSAAFCDGRKQSFQELLGSARTQGERLLPEIQARARNLNLTQLPGLIRGGWPIDSIDSPRIGARQ